MLSTTTTTTNTEVQGRGAGSILSLHPDIIQTHILTRLDGPSLASVSCTSTSLHHLSSQEGLWSNICHDTWPSSIHPRVRQVISDVGPLEFFANAYPLPPVKPEDPNRRLLQSSELISAVDIHYQNKLIFTKVHETETASGWFRCSPFRIDLLEPKDVVATAIDFPNGDGTCESLMEEMTLSWILIDPDQGLAVNISSQKPVSVQRHWLTGQVQARFGLAQKGTQLGIVVTCSGWSSSEMVVKEVSLEAEDIDGRHLNGKDSLVILQGALEGKKGKGINRVEEGRRRYEEFLGMKRERKENKLKREGVLDVLCVTFGVSLFVAFFSFFLCR